MQEKIKAEKNCTIFDDRQTANSYTVDGLKPYTTYMVSIAVITKAGEGAHSDPLYNTTLESAPDPVMDVSVSEVSNTSMIVSWSPPMNMNGHFRYYTVHYNNRTAQNHFKIEKETQTMGQPTLGEWKVAMKNLSPFETYYVSVTACTVACSEINKTVSVTTLVGVPGEIDTPIIQRINSSLVSVQWQPPRNPGGIINYYEILVQQSDNKNNLSSIYYTSYGMLTFDELIKYFYYYT
uniref:Fibronectin type-III domain-containing protein n=1 Tax=Timema genevievae TaxID=629358 RepID=A0A7R9K814_TIMGE|nr:unnamed protein product [Timema genevievae]